MNNADFRSERDARLEKLKTEQADLKFHITTVFCV
jgi:ribosomal protein L29